MSKIENMQDKVAKLLRQAEDVVGTPEDAVFQAKAFEIMAKYGIEHVAVDAARQGLDTSDLRDAIKWEVVIDGKYANAQMLLLHNLAVTLHSKTVYLKDRSGVLRMYVYGVPTHIDRIKMLWEILQPQMMRLVEKVRPETPLTKRKATFNWDTSTYEYTEVPAPGRLKSYRRSWIAGFAQAVGDRLRIEEVQALAADTSGALVLFRGDKERAEVALRKAHPRLRNSRGSRVDAGGYAHGQRDGRNSMFNRSLSG